MEFWATEYVKKAAALTQYPHLHALSKVTAAGENQIAKRLQPAGAPNQSLIKSVANIPHGQGNASLLAPSSIPGAVGHKATDDASFHEGMLQRFNKGGKLTPDQTAWRLRSTLQRSKLRQGLPFQSSII
jgi:hypothetical protein